MAALTQSHLGSTYPLPCWLKLCSAMLAQPICKHLPPPFSLLSCPHAQSLRSRHDFDFPPSLQQFKQGAGFTHTPVRSGFRLHPYMLELKNRMGATPTLLYARIPTWSVSRPLSLSLPSLPRAQSLKSRHDSLLPPFLHSHPYMVEFSGHEHADGKHGGKICRPPPSQPPLAGAATKTNHQKI